MKNWIKFGLIGVLLVLVLFFMFNSKENNITGKTVLDNKLTKVESEYVCMVTDKLFDSPQIPVEINDQTYYGCCMGCKAKLENYPETRYAIDPVTNNKVDKAKAIIGLTSSDQILYFESQETFNEYNKN